ncbi:MAG: Uma2 family endonuclease [Armatimonadaceae bacterium]
MGTTLDYDRDTGRVIWSRDTFHALGQAGFLDDGRYELLEGEIVRIVPPNEPHNFVSMECVRALVDIFGWDYVRMEGSVVLSDTSEPVPDVTVTDTPRSELVRIGIPDGSRIRLAVEVSDTSTGRDLGQKARLYARAGVPQYWVVDVNRRCVVVHRLPGADGYAQVRDVAEGDSVALPELPEGLRFVDVAQLLPPRSR